MHTLLRGLTPALLLTAGFLLLRLLLRWLLPQRLQSAGALLANLAFVVALTCLLPVVLRLLG